jgi:hypothetical protein
VAFIPATIGIIAGIARKVNDTSPGKRTRMSAKVISIKKAHVDKGDRAD